MGPGDLETAVALGWAWVWLFGSFCFQPPSLLPTRAPLGGGDGGALCRWGAAHSHAKEVLMVSLGQILQPSG